MAKQVKPESSPKWYAVFALTLHSAGGVEEKHQIRLSLGKIKITTGRTSTTPPATTTSTTVDWNKGYRIVEALRPCVISPWGITYGQDQAFLEIHDTRMVGA